MFLSNDPAVMQHPCCLSSTAGFGKTICVEDGEAKDCRRRMLHRRNPASKNSLPPKWTRADAGPAGIVAAKATEEKQPIAELWGQDERSGKANCSDLVKPNAAQARGDTRTGAGSESESSPIGFLGWVPGNGIFDHHHPELDQRLRVCRDCSEQIRKHADSRHGRMAADCRRVLLVLDLAGDSRTWLGIVASTFGAILLPIAYISFFALMNNFAIYWGTKNRRARG